MSYHITIKTEALHRLMYNTKLFQTGKIKKPAVMTLGPATAMVEVDDRVAYFNDTAETLGGPAYNKFELAPEVVKEWELQLRDGADGEQVDLVYTMMNNAVTFNGVDYDVKQCGAHEYSDMWDSNKWDAPEYDSFEVWGDRWRKLSLIEPRDYPQSFRPVKHEKYGDLLLFKIGPTIRGALSLVDHKELRERIDAGEFLC